MIRQNIDSGWSMRRVGDEALSSAVVPGSVYTDMLRNGQMEDPFFKDNELKALKLMDEDYEYKAEFYCEDALLDKEHIILRFDGVDTVADLYLNGTHLDSVCNMHRIWEYEVTHLLLQKENELRVIFHSPTKYIADAYAASETHGSDDAMEGFVHLRKAHCMFGWDWGAHLPDAGLFRPVWLIGFDEARIDSVYVTQKHANGQVTLGFEVEIEDYPEIENYLEENENLFYRVTITDPEGGSFTTDDSPEEIVIEDAKLWWPNGYGEQNLYRVDVTLFTNTDDGGEIELDCWSRRIGLRTMTMHIEKDQWGESFACQVNGVDIFAMGADYIPEDHLLGRVTPETTRVLLEKSKWANFNSIRVWGGGYYPDDWFYDICDELGLVVWQDFMFACGVYDLTPEFEENIRAEFVDNVKRLRHHASLGLWCGNNEMEQFVAVDMWITKRREVRDYLIMYERIIPEVLAEYDPQTFYWPSSPSSGGSFDDPQDPNRGDVHYWEVWHGNKPFTDYRNYYFRYLSEFGFQSFPSVKTIETFTDDPADLNIFSYVMEKHQRNGSANGKIMNYMQQTYRYPSSFETVLYASQLLQADGIRYGVEHFRRNRGRCMGAIYWQLNDCWSVASWSSIDYCGRLKALHYYAKRFFAPLMLSCEEQGMMSSGKVLNWQHFDEFEKSIRLNVANETREDAVVTVRWALRNPKAEILQSDEQQVKVPALTSVWLDKVEFPDVDVYTQYISYEMEQDGAVISDGTVNFSYPKYFRYEDPQLTCRVIEDEIEVTASAYAKSVEILNEKEDLILSDNYFDMNAGTKRVKIESGDAGSLRLRSVYDIR
ncbi:MAG: beta-mannosidase [Marvinbryantia sp.]